MTYSPCAFVASLFVSRLHPSRLEMLLNLPLGNKGVASTALWSPPDMLPYASSEETTDVLPYAPS